MQYRFNRARVIVLACAALLRPGFAREICGEQYTIARNAPPAARVIEYATPGRGTIYVYAESSATDPALTVLLPDADPIADRDGGGGTTSFVEARVAAAASVRVDVASEGGPDSAEIRVTVSFAPSTEHTLGLAAAVKRARTDAEEWMKSRRLTEARRSIATALDQVLADSDARECGACVLESWFALAVVNGLGMSELEVRICEWILAFREQTHPVTAMRRIYAEKNLLVRLRTLGRTTGALPRAERLLKTLDGINDPSDPTRVDILELVATLKQDCGAIDDALAIQEEVVALRSKGPPDNRLWQSKGNLGAIRFLRGDRAVAREIYEDLLAGNLAIDPRQRFQWTADLALCLESQKERDRQIALLEEAIAWGREFLSPGDPRVFQWTRSLGDAISASGRAEDAARVVEIIEAAIEEIHTADVDETTVLLARSDLAQALLNAGRAPAAFEVMSEIEPELARRLAPDDPKNLRVRQLLGLAASRTERLELAETVFRDVLARRRSAVRQAPLEIRRSVLALGRVILERSRHHEVLELLDSIAVEVGRLPVDDRERMQYVILRATVDGDLGRLREARESIERLLADVESLVSKVDPDLLKARQQLVRVLGRAGDETAAAREFDALHQEVCSQFPAEHPTSVRIHYEYAHRLMAQGRHANAAEHLGRIVESYRAERSERSSDLAWIRLTYATQLLLSGAEHEADGEIALVDAFLASAEAGLEMRVNRLEFDATRASLRGDLAAAIAASEGVSALLRERANHGLEIALTELAEKSRRVMWSLPGALAGEEAASRRIVIEMQAMEDESVRWMEDVASSDAPATAQALVNGLSDEIDVVVSAAAALRATALGADAAAVAFRLAESSRSIAIVAGRVGRQSTRGAESDGPALADARDRLMRAQADVRTASAAGASGAAAYAQAVRERDAAARAVRSMVKSVNERCWPDLRRPGEIFSDGQVALAFRSVVDFRDSTRRLFAFVIRHASNPLIVDLGEVDRVDSAAMRWRDALIDARSTSDARRHGGRALAEIVLAPLVPYVRDAVRVHVVPCGLLATVPLDQLPDPRSLEGDGRSELWFERTEIVTLPALSPVLDRRLADADAPSIDRPSLLTVGGIAFGIGANSQRDDDPSAPGSNGALPFSAIEAVRVGVAFRSHFGQAARAERLDLDGATVERFRELAPGATFLHVATHTRVRAGGEMATRETNRLAADAPLSLVDLAFANATRLFADDLASLDLTACRLAVLATCESARGIEVPGQGVQSLATAFHAAGAGATVASLWSVDDAATQRFFEVFYRALWVNGLTPSAAVRAAKIAMRRDRVPEAHYAAWIASASCD